MKKHHIFTILFVAITLIFTIPAITWAGSSATAIAGASIGNTSANAAGGSASVGNTSANAAGGSASVGNTSANSTGGNANIGNTSATGVAGDVTSGNSQVTTVNFPEQKDITTTRSEGHGYRGYANPAEIHYPGTPGYFGSATRGSSFATAKTLLKYKKSFNVNELKRMAKSSFGSKLIVTPLVDKVPDTEKPDTVTMYLVDPTTTPTMLGYITVKATSKNVVSLDILAEAALKARDLGGNAIQVSAEGVERMLSAFGWGIGLSYTSAHINNDETNGGVAAGGLGISGGTAGYHDLPWIQIFVLDIK